MTIYPAIDILDGRVVRLAQGDFASATYYHDDPLAQAVSFAEAGAEWVHMVDLSAAKSGPSQVTSIVADVARSTGMKVQVGGGIRERGQIDRLLEAGARRIVIGSLAVREVDTVRGWLKDFGGQQICVAADVAIEQDVPMMRVNAWRDSGGQSLWDFLNGFASVGLLHVLCTDVSRDGLLQGPNFELYDKAMAQYPNLQVQASAGVKSLDDIRELKEKKLAGVIVGRALYEGCFTLAEALAC